MLTLVIGFLLLGGTLGFSDPHFTADKFGIVHLFEWHWDTIANECETFLAPKKIGGVQVRNSNKI